MPNTGMFVVRNVRDDASNCKQNPEHATILQGLSTVDPAEDDAAT